MSLPGTSTSSFASINIDVGFDAASLEPAFTFEDLSWADALSWEDTDANHTSSPVRNGQDNVSPAFPGHDLVFWNSMLSSPGSQPVSFFGDNSARPALELDGELDDESASSWDESLGDKDEELTAIWAELRELIRCADRLTTLTPPLCRRRRRKVHKNAHRLGLVHATISSGQAKHVLMSKCTLTQDAELHEKQLDTPCLVHGLVDASTLHFRTLAPSSDTFGPAYYLRPANLLGPSEGGPKSGEGAELTHTYQRSLRRGPSVKFSITDLLCSCALPLPDAIVAYPRSPGELYLHFPTALEAAKVNLYFVRLKQSTNSEKTPLFRGYARFINQAAYSAFKDGLGASRLVESPARCSSRDQDRAWKQRSPSDAVPWTSGSNSAIASVSSHPTKSPPVLVNKRKRSLDATPSFQCSSDGCTKTFRNKGERRKHEKIHQERTHFCDVCEARPGFLYPKDLKRHRKNVHKLEQ